jgi:hypothetical protein
MDGVVFCIVIVAVFPVSFVLARGCLRGVIRIVTGRERRNEGY